MDSSSKTDKRLADEIRASLDAQVGRHDKWRLNRRMYYNEHDGPITPFDGAFSATYPITTEIIDRLGASCIDIITGAEPYCYPTSYTDEDASDIVEKTVQFFFEISKFREALKKVSAVAGWSNRGWVKALWDSKTKTFKYRVIEPFNQFVYPAYIDSLADASSFGDMVVRRRSQILQMMEDKIYDKVELPSSADGEFSDFTKEDALDKSQAVSSDTKKPSPDDKFTVYDCMCQKDGKWRRKSIIYPCGLVLKDDPWPDGMPFSRGEFGYKPSVPDHGYWPPVSVVQDIAQYQLDYDAHACDAINAARMQAYPALIVKGGIESSKSLAKYGPSQVIEGDVDNVAPIMPSLPVDIHYQGMQQARDGAERVSRVSSLVMGDGGKSKTATQSAGEQQWQAQMVNEYIRTIGTGVLQLADFTQSALYQTWDEWFPDYGKFLGLEESDREAFKLPMVWSLTVESVEGTAMSQMAMIDGLANYAADPEFGVDKHGLLERRLKTMERSGVTAATELQQSTDPLEAVAKLAQQLGIEPDILAYHVDAALGEAQNGDIQGLQTLESLTGDTGGLGEPVMEAPGIPPADGAMQPGGPTAVPGSV